MALTLLMNISSVYPYRARPKALAACARLALHRESCGNYPELDLMTPWSEHGSKGQRSWYEPDGKRIGWIMDRITQEHDILSWTGQAEDVRQLGIEQKLQPSGRTTCALLEPAFSTLS